MSILTRFKDIMASNINAALDRCEDPAKMIDQYLRNAKSDLAKVKSETAAVMAEEVRAKRELQANTDSITRYEALAAKAVAAGEEDDALEFLEEQSRLESNHTTLVNTYNLSASNAKNMRELYNKLVADIKILESKRTAIKAKVSVAKTQETVNSIGANSGKYGATLSKFEDMEKRVDARLDKAMAEADLDMHSSGNLSELEKKYTSGSVTAKEKLAALKAKMNADANE
jgi:phage shock protein A